MPGHNRFRLDDEQRRTPMAPEAGEREPEETIGGRESGALMNRAFEDSDLMAQSQDLELEVKARTKDRSSVMRSASGEVGIEGENSGSSIIRSRSDLSRFSRGTDDSDNHTLLQEGRPFIMRFRPPLTSF